MRIIKFRAISITDGKFVEGMTISKGTINRKRNLYYMEVGVDKWTGIDPASIGQFTGIVDMNGKEMYEGDVVNWDTTEAEFKPDKVVTYDADNGCYCFGDMPFNRVFESGFYQPDLGKSSLEIKGNIHEPNNE